MAGSEVDIVRADEVEGVQGHVLEVSKRVLQLHTLGKRVTFIFADTQKKGGG